MKQSEAMDYVRKLIFGLQRARSVEREALGESGEFSAEVVERVLADLTPWMNGEKGKSFLEILVKVEERGTVAGMDLYNFMTVIHLLEPTASAVAGMLSGTTFPEPDLQWVLGWEAE